MSKQKKASEQETNQDPLADLIQPKTQAPMPAKPGNTDDLAAMEQDLLQTAESPLFDPETLAALSDLAEMEASLLLNPLAAPKPQSHPPAAEANKPDWLEDDLYGEDVPTLPEDEGLLELLDQATDALLAGQADDIFWAADLDQTAVFPTPPADEPEPTEDWEAVEAETAVPDNPEDTPFALLESMADNHNHQETWDDLPADTDEADALAALEAAEAPLAPEESDALDALQAFTADLSHDETDALAALQSPAATELTADESDALDALQPTDYLHQIIATIDEEVETAYGDSTMVDLAGEQLATPLHNLRQYVVFVLAGELYAAPAHHVREVAQLTAVTRIPNVPGWLLGVTNLRGDVLSLIGLRTFLGLAANGTNGHSSDRSFTLSESQVMVVHSEKYASNITTGLVVDEIQDIRYLDTDQIGSLTAPIEDQVAPFLQGVYEENGRLLVLLDLEKLLLSPAIWQFDLA